MKNLRGDWKDKQGIFQPIKVDKQITEEQKAEILAECRKTGQLIYSAIPTREQVIEILEKYNALLKEEYQDSDLWEIIPQTVDKFLIKYYPKI